MASIVLLMSSLSNSAVEPEIVTSSMPKPKQMLDGFPWVSAIILYTLSWGWSLLRPNTLYWEDWDCLQWTLKTGRCAPSWRGVTPYGVFFKSFPKLSVTLLTFMLFFLAGIFLFGILKQFRQLDLRSKQVAVLIFLVIPVYHARVSGIVFGHAVNYFTFFLGWVMIVQCRKIWICTLALLAIFLSLHTESLLFFVLLPFANFLWLNKVKLLSGKEVQKFRALALVFMLLPPLFISLRTIFWPTRDDNYRELSFDHFVLGFTPIFIASVFLAVLIFRYRKTKTVNIGIALAAGGLWIFALALFPYFLAGSIAGYGARSRSAYVTVFEFRAAWRSRHLLLTPLGLSLMIVGLNQLCNPRNRNYLLKFILTSSVLLNMFFGSQYFLQSHKQEQLVALFKSTKDEIVIASVSDQTIRFMGRGSEFISDEWFGLMTEAVVPDEWIGLMDLVGPNAPDRPGCEALPSGSALILKSDTPYLKALVTRDLGLYFEVTPCSEVLAKDG